MRPIILCYHRVAEYLGSDLNKLAVDPARFRDQLLWLRRRNKFLTLEDILTYRPKNSIALTFDDGYRDNFTVAADILTDLGIPATFFLATRYIEEQRLLYPTSLASIYVNEPAMARSLLEELGATVSPSSHYFELLNLVRQIPLADLWAAVVLLDEVARDRGGVSEFERPLLIPEVDEIAASSLFTIGPHTHQHPELAKQSISDCARDFNQSFEFVNRRWPDSSHLLSFPAPFGQKADLNRQFVESLNDRGIVTLSTFPKSMAPRDEYMVGRISVQNWAPELLGRVVAGVRLASRIPFSADLLLTMSRLARAAARRVV